MKKLDVIIRPERYQAVREALNAVGVGGLTVSEVMGAGLQGGRTETYRGSSYSLQLLPKLKLEVVLPDEALEPALEAICAAAQTGAIGDGKIFIYNIEDAVRIRTLERGATVV